MDWQEHFANLFFKTWHKAGLPNPIEYGEDYVRIREGAGFVNRYIEVPFEPDAALEKNLLNSIYGFGSLHGNMFGKLLNLNETVTTEASDWCGRFNLGISLFDYLSDETQGGISSVISLDAFQPFIEKKKSTMRELTSTEEFLNNLTNSVLNDLLTLEKQNQKPNDLMQLMRQLFEAQMFLSKQILSHTKDLNRIKQALFQKSAEPFRVMAEYTLLVARNKNPKLLNRARSLGTAVGSCYWLIDDAKDVMIDLEAGEWNIFLQLAAQQNDAIFKKVQNNSFQEGFEEIWKQDKSVEKMISKTIQDLFQVTQELEVSESIIKHELGLLGAALWHWSKF